MPQRDYLCDCGNRWSSTRAGANEGRKCNDCDNICFPVSGGPSDYQCRCGNRWSSRNGGIKECRVCKEDNAPLEDESDYDSTTDEEDERESELRQKEQELDVERQRLYNEKLVFELQKQQSQRDMNKSKEEVSKAKNDVDRSKILVQQEKAELEREKRSLQVQRQTIEAEKRKLEEEKRKLAEEQKRMQKEKSEVNFTKTRDGKPERGEAKENNSDMHTEPEKGVRDGNNEAKGAQAWASEQTDEVDNGAALKAKEKGDRYRSRGEVEAAIKQYTVAIGLAPREGSFYTSRCVTYMELGMYQDALGDAKKAVDLDITNIEAQKKYVECLLALGEGTLAERACRQLRERAPHLPDVPDLLAKAVDVRDLREQITDCMERRVYQEALHKLNQVLVKCVRCPVMLLIQKAEVLVHLGKYAEAEDILSKLDEQNDTNICFVRALILYKQFKLCEAQKGFRSLLDRVPGDVKITKIYKICKKMNELVESGEKADLQRTAVDKYTEALAVDPESRTVNARLFFIRGTCLFFLKEYMKAIDDMTRAIECDPSYDSYFGLRGGCYMKILQYEAAMDDFEVAYGKTGSAETKKKLDEATKKFEEAEAKNNKDYYAALEVTRSATVPDIKKAYMKFAKLHHPDRHTDALPSAKLRQERRFKLISEAYNTLSDPQKRKEYDRKTR